MPTATRVITRFQDLDDVTWTPPVDGAIPYYNQTTGKMTTGGVRANAAQLIPGDGAAATPAVVGATDLTSGLYFGLNAVNVSVGGALKAAFGAAALTLSMTLAMGANLIQFTDLTILRETTTLAGQDKSELAIRNGTNQQGFNIYRTFTDVNNYARFGLFWSGNDAYFGQDASAIAGTGAGGDLYVAVTSGQTVRLRPGGTNFTFSDGAPGVGGAVLPIALTLTTYANKSAITQSGYSLTGATALPLASLAGALNTLGVVDVFKLAIADTAHGVGSYLLALYGGIAGATALMRLDLAGLLSVVALGITGALAAAPATSLLVAAVNKYGGDTNILGDPTEWLYITTVNGQRKSPLYAA